MLTIRNLKKSFGGRTLFTEADMQINYGERVALVGPNGAGKSTIFGLILGHDEADEGTIERDEWTTVGFLPQEAESIGNETVIEIATGRAGEMKALEAKLKALEAEGNVECIEYYEAHGKHDALMDPTFEAKAKKVLFGLGYKEEDFNRGAKELSGGWIMRAHLARLLVMAPDLLMLDEPTNHLDLLSLLWLQEYLKTFSGAVLMISHDRQFMDELVDKTYEISETKLIEYKGNYTAFLEKRQENYDRQLAAYQNQQKEIAQLNEFVERFRSLPSKAAQAQSKLKQIERMALIEKPTPPRRPFRFQFPSPPRVGQIALELKGLHMAYGTRKIYEGIDFDLERGDRIAFVGPNGSGKSTLLKILAGELEFQQGERKECNTSRIGYFSQHRAATLDPNNTVLEEVLACAKEMREDEARGVLGSFMFKRDDIYKKTDVLSGGEKSRLNLVKFLVNPPNILLMDEPTTHLDILTVESLIIAFERFEGVLAFISHDVHFIRQLATKIVHIVDGKITPYYGGYDYYLEKSGASDARTALTSS